MVAVLAQRVANWTPRRRLRVASVAVLLLALLLAYLFVRSDAMDPEIRNDVMLSLRELEKLDAEWDANILRAHIGRAPAAPQLTTELPRMRDLQRRLGEAMPARPDPALREAWLQLGDAMQRKELLAVQFARHNPPLRTALGFLPPAVADLKTELAGIEGALAPARLVVRLDASLNTLLTDILRYNVVPSPALAARIEEVLGDIAAQQIAFSPAVVEKMEAIVKAARIILEKRPLENRLEGQIAATGTGAALDRLGRAFDRRFDAALAVRERYRGYLAAYAVLLLVLLAWAGVRLRRSYRIIGEVNHRLQAANEHLEQRVAERTAALESQSKQLERLAQHDSLTGLINYRQLTRLLERALARADRRGTVVVIMFIDLDGFKAVNDTYGHATGDLVLQMVARRVQDKLRAEDALARLGGDEFVIMLEEVASREGALRVAQLTLDQINAITEADGNPVAISASIGISSARGHHGAARGSAALLGEADKAMYEAKNAGKGVFVVSPAAEWVVPGEALDAASHPR